MNAEWAQVIIILAGNLIIVAIAFTKLQTSITVLASEMKIRREDAHDLRNTINLYMLTIEKSLSQVRERVAVLESREERK